MARCLWAIVAILVLSATAACASATFYGYVKLDACYDDARTDRGDYAFLVLDEPADDEFNMTANQTRLGVKLAGPDSGGMDVSGKVEIDLYGGGAENKPNPMLRHAYFEMKFPTVDILAGQTWDVFAPLNPMTLNYVVLWKCGNTGYRRPQVRVAKVVGLGERSELVAAVSLNRSIGPQGSGEDSGIPTTEGRVAFSQTLSGGESIVLGVSGAWGRQEWDDFGKDLDVAGMAVDMSLPLGSVVTLKGEYFTGKNVAVFLGGIGQGVDEVNETEIEASGGWGQLSLDLGGSVRVNLGAGIDDPCLSDDDTGNTIDKNVAYFANLVWSFSPATMIGFEYERLETTYKGGDLREDNRGQLSLLYHF